MMRFLLLALLLLSAASFGGTKVTPNVGSNMSILNSSNTGYLSGTNYWKQGDTVTSYMERLGRHTPIGVTPSRGVPTSRIASAAKNILRLTPSAVASSLAFTALLDSVGWFIDSSTGDLQKQPEFPFTYDGVPASTDPGTMQSSCTYAAQQLKPSAILFGGQNLLYYASSPSFPEGFQYLNNCGSRGYVGFKAVPSGFSFDSAPVESVTSSQIDDLEVSGDASFYDGLMRDACNLSSSPSRCFDDLVEQRTLQGPATVTGPSTTTTSTQTNTDGSTTTVTKDTQTDFDIAYGDDHFVYTPKTTTETKVDGQTTETTTEQEDTDADSEQKPEEEAVSEIAGLQCEAAVSCSGDAIQCAIAKTQKDTKCILQDAFDYTSQKSDVETVFQGDEYVIEDEEIDIPSFIGQGARFLPATCPAPIPMSLSGKNYSLDTQPFCTFATDLSFLIVAFATLAAALYIGRAFGGE